MTTTWQQLDGPGKAALIRPYIEVQRLSYSATAKLLGISRLAVAGAADRHGIISPFSKGVTGRGSKGAAAQKARAMPKKLAARKHDRPGKRVTAPKTLNKFVADAIPDAAIDKTPLRKDAWTALPGTTPKPLDQHKEHTCRWPIGTDGPYTFCCEKVQDGSSWCPTHRKLAYKPRPAPKFNGRKVAS